MPFFLLFLVGAFASILLGSLFKPKVRDNSAPATLKDLDFPTADPTRAVPVVWGTVKLDAPNVIWYGDLQTQKITKKVKTGLFSSDKQTLAYRYFLGLDLALCHGTIDSLEELHSDDKIVATGMGITNGAFTVNNLTVFGGDSEDALQKSGEGGLYASCVLYNGSQSQSADSYLTSILTTVPGYRGIAHVVWKGPSSNGKVSSSSTEVNVDTPPYLSGYLGISPRIKPLAFVVKRLPNYLNATYKNINSGDANPADVIWELLIDNEWGMGLPSSFLDTTSFQSAQQTLYNDGLGFSGIWDSPKPISEVLDEILRYIDGLVYVDPQTGLIKIKLIRNDYNTNTIPVFDEDNIVECSSFSRPSWDETTNEVKVTFVDRFNKFKADYAPAQDSANIQIQGGAINSTTTSYVGISNKTVANKIAFRDLRTLASTPARLTIKTDRDGATLRPGDPFKLNWSDYGISNLIMRVARVSYGELTNGMVEIDAVEDVFAFGSAVYNAPANSSWSNPVVNASTPTTFIAQEAPFAISGEDCKLKVFALKPNTGQFSFNTLVADGSSSGTYFQISSGDPYTPSGLINAQYPQLTADIDTINTITITAGTPDTLSLIKSLATDEVAKGKNLALLINGTVQEIIAYETVVDNNNGTYTISNIWRGLFDTTPQVFPTNSRIYFFSYGEAYPSTTYDSGRNLFVKIQSVAGNELSSLSSAFSLTTNRRALRPYPPGKIQINGSTTPSVIASGDVVLAWEHRNRLRQSDNIVKQFDTGIDIEPRTTVVIKIYNASNTLLRTVTDLTASTFTYTSAMQIADNGSEPNAITFHIYSVREGLYSLFPQQRQVTRTGGTAPSPPTYSPGSDNYTPAPISDAASIAGYAVVGTPSNNNILRYQSSSNNLIWSTDAGTPKIQTILASSADSHTSTGTWEDINSMSLTVVPTVASSVVFCTFTCKVTGKSANFEQLSLRFLMDGSTASETWTKAKNDNPANDENLLITVHTAFTGVSAASHTIKVQWHDNSSGLDVDFAERRLTTIIGS